jgi:hypothetical protein
MESSNSQLQLKKLHVIFRCWIFHSVISHVNNYSKYLDVGGGALYHAIKANDTIKKLIVDKNNLEG